MYNLIITKYKTLLEIRTIENIIQELNGYTYTSNQLNFLIQLFEILKVLNKKEFKNEFDSKIF